VESIESDDWAEAANRMKPKGNIGGGLLSDSVENALRGARAWEDRVRRQATIRIEIMLGVPEIAHGWAGPASHTKISTPPAAHSTSRGV
jgi:hypothetical protein